MTHPTVPHTGSKSSATVPANNRFLVGIAVGALVSLGVVAIAVGSGAGARLASVPLGPMESRAYTQPFDGASRANVRLQFGAGQLTVGALEAGHASLATATSLARTGAGLTRLRSTAPRRTALPACEAEMVVVPPAAALALRPVRVWFTGRSSTSRGVSGRPSRG